MEREGAGPHYYDDILVIQEEHEDTEPNDHIDLVDVEKLEELELEVQRQVEEVLLERSLETGPHGSEDAVALGSFAALEQEALPPSEVEDPRHSVPRETRQKKGGDFERARLRQYIFYLQQGALVKKKMGNEKDYHERYIFVSEDVLSFSWSKGQGHRHQAKSVPLMGLSLRAGSPALKHKKDAAAEGYAACSLSIVLAHKFDHSTAIDLWFESEAVRDAWGCQLAAVLHMLHYPQDGPREVVCKSPGKVEEGPRPFALALMQELSEGSLVRYIERNNLTARSKRKKTAQELACHREQPLTHPITDLPDTLAPRAVECFQLIMQYMGDAELQEEERRSPDRGAAGLAGSPSGAASSSRLSVLRRITALGESTVELRDEMYLQLAKQTNDNPREASLIRGWMLLAGCAHTFLPLDPVLHTCLTLHADKARFRPDAVGGIASYVHCILCEGQAWTRRLGVTAGLLWELQRKFVPTTIFGGNLGDVLRKEVFLRRLGSQSAPEDMPSSSALVKTAVVPEVLQVLTRKFLALDGYGVDGVFRRAADTDRVAELKRKLEEGSYVVYGTEAVATDEVLVVADLIKMWLRSLSEPLIPFRFYDRAIEAGKAVDCDLARELLLELPPANLETLRYLLRFLNGCADAAHRNQMTQHNLSLVFSPNVLHNPNNDPLIMMTNTDLEKRFVSYLMDAARALDS